MSLWKGTVGGGGAYGQLSRDISARESMIVFVVGHERFGG